jgi:bifunctional non-homologous end joining protein LigD
MSDRLPERRELPSGLVLDGELVAFNDAGAPHWPLVVERMLHGKTAIPVTFVAFDLLRVNGHDATCNPWSQRRTLLEGVWLDCGCGRLADVFDDGYALFAAVVEHGLEGVVAKRCDRVYRPGYRGWTKIKNPGYWRRESELEPMQRQRNRAAA